MLVPGNTAVTLCCQRARCTEIPAQTAKRLFAGDGATMRTIALDEVETPAIIADIVSKPLHPGCDVFAHSLLAVIQVGGCNVVLLGLVGACAPKLRVVVAEVGLVPGQPASKLVPLAIFLQQLVTA